MKCVCGYEYEENYTGGEKIVVAGDAPFRRYTVVMFNCDEHSHDTKTIYVCPKCATMRFFC